MLRSRTDTGGTKPTASATCSLLPTSETREQAWYRGATQSEVLRDGRQAVLADHSTDGSENIRDREGGEPRSKGPAQGKERPGITSSGRNYERYSGIANHITETPEDCGTGTELSGDGVQQSVSPDRPGTSSGSLSPDEQRQCGGGRQGNCERLRRSLVRKPPRPARAVENKPIRGSAR